MWYDSSPSSAKDPRKNSHGYVVFGNVYSWTSSRNSLTCTNLKREIIFKAYVIIKAIDRYDNIHLSKSIFNHTVWYSALFGIIPEEQLLLRLVLFLVTQEIRPLPQSYFEVELSYTHTRISYKYCNLSFCKNQPAKDKCYILNICILYNFLLSYLYEFWTSSNPHKWSSAIGTVKFLKNGANMSWQCRAAYTL